MKHTSILFLTILYFSAYQLFAQSNSILRIHPVRVETNPAFVTSQLFMANPRPVYEGNSGKAAHRSGMALVVLGPAKMVVGLGCLAGMALDLSNPRANGIGAIFWGSLGGFHLLSGAGVTAGGVVLLRKAKRQREANNSRVYLDLPDFKTFGSTGNAAPALGLRTTLTF